MIEKLRKKIFLIVLFAISIPLLFIIIFYTISYRENIIRTNAQFVDRMFVNPNGKSDNNSDDTNSGKTDNKSEDNNSNESTSETDDNAEIITCTIYISCASVLNYMDKLSDSTKKIIPEDGVILNLTEVKIKKGSTVFDVLQKAARDNKVHLEYNYTPAYKTYYIEGIGNLYQFDAGNLSGWMYSVNDAFPGVGCSGYTVSDGDSIKWVYTCSFGKDVGGYVGE